MPVPQPTKVSHDGGCTDRSGARVPRCAPTGLSHATEVCRRPEQAVADSVVGDLYGCGVAFLRRASRRRATQRLLKISAAAPAMTQPTDPPWR